MTASAVRSADRSRLRVLSLWNVACGLWLVVAAFALPLPRLYPHQLTLLNFVITGTGVLTLAVTHALRWSELRWASWGNVMLGCWLAVSPVVLGNTKFLHDARVVALVSVATGAAVVAGAALALAGSEQAPRTSSAST